MDFDDPDLERRLHDQRPVPDPVWKLQLREDVIEPARHRRRLKMPSLRWLPVAAGASVATVAVLVAGLSGGGPLGGLSDQPVSADDKCRYVTEVRSERVPRVIRSRDGELIVRYRERLKPVRVERCG